jgi:hypothetical protein
MTHTQLKSFLAIARYRSFTAAADQLYISQSALSQQMKSLEQELGFTVRPRFPAAGSDRSRTQLLPERSKNTGGLFPRRFGRAAASATTPATARTLVHWLPWRSVLPDLDGIAAYGIAAFEPLCPPPCPLRKQRCTLHSSAARRSSDRRPPGKRRYCPSWAAVSAFCTGTRTLHAVVPFHGCNDLTAAAKKFCTPRGSAGTTDCVPSSSRQHFI